MNIKSGSAFNNIAPFFWFTLMIGFDHLVVLMLLKLVRHCKAWKTKNFIYRCTKCCIIKTFKFLTFTYYVRNVMEAYMHMVISSISELNRFDRSSGTQITSLILAIIILMFLVACIAASLRLLLLISLETKPPKFFEFTELFNGLKLSRTPRIYAVVFFVRRLILVSLLIFASSLETVPKITIMVLLQMIYLGFIGVLRPFEFLKNNIIDIVNEVFFMVLVVLLFYANVESRWDLTLTDAYLTIILMNNVTVLAIVAGTFYSELFERHFLLKLHIHAF